MQTRLIRLFTALLLLSATALLGAQEISDEFMKTYRAYDQAFKQGNMQRAAELARKSLDLAVAELGAGHEKIPVLRINLGHALLLNGDLEAAEQHLSAAEKVLAGAEAGNRANLITIHQDLARIHAAREKFDAARTALDRAIDLRTEESGSDDPRLAELLSMKARLDIAEQRFDSAESLLNQGLTILEDSFGEEHTRVIGYISSLGDLAVMRNELAKAETLYQRALGILQRKLLADDPSVLAMHQKLAKLYIAMDSDKFAGHADTYIANADLDEGAALPLFIIKPGMPDSVSANSGWVLLEMTVTADGRVENPRVIESSPAGQLDQVAVNAARKWRFKPRIEDGERQSQPNTRARIVFQGQRVQVHLGEMG